MRRSIISAAHVGEHFVAIVSVLMVDTELWSLRTDNRDNALPYIPNGRHNAISGALRSP